MTDDEFKPRLGRLRASGPSGKRTRKFLGRIVAATARTGASTGVRSRRFDGSRIGRGASVGRVLRGGDRHSGLRSRRVVIKARLVKLGTKGVSASRAHLRYIQRDSATPDGAPAGLYSADRDVADGAAFVERGSGDRHQFRFIVSAEDGDEYPDLKPFVRRLMTQMEEDLGTKLDWVAADHRDTGHPHSHIMLRGKDDRGENLIIAHEYIAHGFRERACALVSLDLGPRTDLEIEERLRHDVGQERLTAIDRRLVRAMDGDRMVSSADRDPLQQSLRAGRLKTLERLGLADYRGGGRWQLADSLEDTLRRMGERGDIIRTMQRELSARLPERAAADQVIEDSSEMQPIVGRVVARGLADELNDRHYLVVDGIDGRSHYIGIGKGDAVEPLLQDAIIRVVGSPRGVREVDRTIAAVAAANDGNYTIDAHLRFDPNASEAFAETHVRRLEALRRIMRSVDREPDGRWVIGPDHLERASAFEARLTVDRPVTVEVLSSVPLDRLRTMNAATWLDRELTSAEPLPVRDAGFGREIRSAQMSRQAWLIEHELAEQVSGRMTYRPDMLSTLQQRELLMMGKRLSEELGKPFEEARQGDRIDGVFRRRIDLASGRFALIEKSREFSLVPWRPILERHVGKSVAGVIRDGGVSWVIGKGRSGPSVE
ncbi:relaxase/mobilization nuclease RlxS [Sphingomonas sp. RB1R13]|uniref:relaxase/mobilization nuclease RlxS n=1 Tax=Sphingomonas sp. RB1R13 TaxID=3096159 RepID=UPI002FC68169